MPRSASRASTPGAGCPYALDPTLITATRGPSAASHGAPLLPEEPWCPTFSNSTRGTRPTSSDSTGSPASPLSTASNPP
jgi:hypothetical protein